MDWIEELDKCQEELDRELKSQRLIKSVVTIEKTKISSDPILQLSFGKESKKVVSHAVLSFNRYYINGAVYQTPYTVGGTAEYLIITMTADERDLEENVVTGLLRFNLSGATDPIQLHTPLKSLVEEVLKSIKSNVTRDYAKLA